jgi:hypothetical protein
MSNDLKTTILGVLSAICGALVTLFPGGMGEMLKDVVAGVGAIALALFGYFSNKSNTTTP